LVNKPIESLDESSLILHIHIEVANSENYTIWSITYLLLYIFTYNHINYVLMPQR